MLEIKNLRHNKAEEAIVKDILSLKTVSDQTYTKSIQQAKKFVEHIRDDNTFSMEDFLSIYNLSSDEGIAILALAEALLRIPDYHTSKELITDKLSNKEWGKYLFKGTLSFKGIFTSFGLYFSGKFSDIIKSNVLLAKQLNRLGQKAFSIAVKQAVLFLSKEFVFSKDMPNALQKQRKYENYRFAFDLLGESARTEYQAEIYYKQYEKAIELLSLEFDSTKHQNCLERPNLSVKLTALYPRFEYIKLQDLQGDFFNKLLRLVKLVEKIILLSLLMRKKLVEAMHIWKL